MLNDPSYYDYTLSKNSKPIRYGSAEADYLTDVLAGEARGIIRSSAGVDRPLFMYLAPTHRLFSVRPPRATRLSEGCKGAKCLPETRIQVNLRPPIQGSSGLRGVYAAPSLLPGKLRPTLGE
jgi:hypothetical protein